MEKKGISKKVIVIAAVIVIIAVVALILFLTKGKNNAYRSIQVYDLKGSATIHRDGVGDVKASEKLFLQSGDKVSVDSDSSMRLKLDDDKYIMVEEKSILTMVADGTKENSKTKIQVEQGAVTNEIQNKLNSKSSYEVSTPNSVMAVRGTVFRVEVKKDENGKYYTRLTTFDGKVGSRLITEDGKYSEDEVLIEAGEEITAYGTTGESQYMGEPEPIDYSTLPVEILKYIKEIVESGRTVTGTTLDELNQMIKEKEGNSKKVETESADSQAADTYIVTFLYKGSVFGKQTVDAGKTVNAPKLAPSASGKWDFDFTTQINQDTSIEWK